MINGLACCSAARRAWWKQIRAWKDEHPLQVVTSDTEIKPQHLMREIDRKAPLLKKWQEDSQPADKNKKK